MTIRARLTVWYASILFASVLLITGLSFYEFAREQAKAKVSHGKEENDEWEDVVQIAFWCGVPATLLGLAGGWWLMRKAMSPVTALTRAAAGIHERNLHERLPRTGNGDELDQLTEVFNAMTGRLDNSFNRIREFTLHASHELKTPLTVMHGELETTLRDETDPASRERLLSQLDEVQRLTKIVDGLTLLMKADAGQIALKREPIRLDELVRDSFADAQILARPHEVRVELTACEEISLPGDRHRLRQLLLNLTDNAIKYNQPKGHVTIALRRVDGSAEISIANTGPGISPESQARVFDRFFRGDLSHNNAVEGCGLGLSISQWIVTAHGGTVQITSQPEKLTTVTVRVPASKS
ncbi:MAG: Integral rane sensor signal transduction histidine kinase [Pedosphaera sp.]|nr:Integral rane sensor signal transduction histidine kinase [Pedosphaera sp.]